MAPPLRRFDIGADVYGFELLLIDDGSRDSSGDICDRYAAADPRVRVFHTPNGGVSSARNLGLDNARGTWITFCDSDDWVEPEYLSTLLTAEDSDLNVVNYILHKDGEKSVLPSNNVCFSGENVLYDFLNNYIQVHILRAPWGKSFKRDIIEKNHLRFVEDILTCEDIIFVLSYCIRCQSIHLYSSVLYNYEFGTVNSANSLSRKNNLYLEQYELVFKILWNINEQFKLQTGLDDDILITTYIEWIFFATLSAIILSHNNQIIKTFGQNTDVRRTIAALSKANAFGVKGKMTLSLIQKGFPRLALLIERMPPHIGGLENS